MTVTDRIFLMQVHKFTMSTAIRIWAFNAFLTVWITHTCTEISKSISKTFWWIRIKFSSDVIPPIVINYNVKINLPEREISIHLKGWGYILTFTTFDNHVTLTVTHTRSMLARLLKIATINFNESSCLPFQGRVTSCSVIDIVE